jgi:hypothetical protein
MMAKHALPLILIVILFVLIVFQVLNLGSVRSKTIATLPIVIPSKTNKPSLPEKSICPAAAQVSVELAQRLTDRPLDQVLCSWSQSCSVRQCSGVQVDRVRAIISKRKQALDLRNKKHALNVASMESAAAILGVLNQEQRTFLLANRDRAVSAIKEAPTWELILGHLEPTKTEKAHE